MQAQKSQTKNTIWCKINVLLERGFWAGSALLASPALTDYGSSVSCSIGNCSINWRNQSLSTSNCVIVFACSQSNQLMICPQPRHKTLNLTGISSQIHPHGHRVKTLLRAISHLPLPISLTSYPCSTFTINYFSYFNKCAYCFWSF